MAAHLSDVISTDQHTVKPWFNGKLTFAPHVEDFAAEGFALIGGRLDYVAETEAAALIYQRRKHTINVFIWPGDAPPPQAVNVRGYALVVWQQAGMNYAAVSDLNVTELSELKALLAK